MRTVDFHILLSLLDHERHGYGIIKEVEAMTSGDVRMGPGTLYGSIKRLINVGLIIESKQRPSAKEDDERRRCYYRVTAAGIKATRAECERLQCLLQIARDKRGPEFTDAMGVG